MASLRDALRAVSAGAAIAAATAAGGPAAGASVAAFLATPAGKRLIDLNIERAEAAQGTTLETEEAILRMGFSEFGQMQQPKPKPRRSRKARSSDKKLSKAFKEANRRMRTKNGSLRKGRSQADVAKLAHRLRKKM
jgi:hypothetical protein